MTLAWIPNSLTMGNLLFGFLSIVFASKQQFHVAGFCILLASLCDGFDGQVARMLKVSSKLGAELDSLADCVAFGVAPGYLAYSAYLTEIIIEIGGKGIPLGIFIAAIFPICAAYRLARFNVAHSTDSFNGLPSPIAGITIALIPITFKDTNVIQDYLFLFIPFFIATALLMVSTLKFSKPQAYLMSRLHGIKLVLFIIVILIFAFLFRKWILIGVVGLLIIYVMSGITSFIIQFIQDHRY